MHASTSSLISCLLALLFATVAQAQELPTERTLPSIQRILHPDGSFPTDSAGSFDATGYQLSMGNNGAPLLRPAGQGDENWQLGFGGAGMDGRVSTIVVTPSGAVYVGGSFTYAGATPAASIAKWNGTGWEALGTGVDGLVSAIVVVADTSIYVSGQFYTAGGVRTNHIAHWDGAAWHAMGSGLLRGSSAAVVDAQGLAVVGRDVYVSGDFLTAGGVNALRIARWDGATWHAMGSGLSAPAASLLAHGTDIYAGGAFRQAGGQPADCIARWNGTTWSPLGAGVNRLVNVMKMIGPDLYVGGSFTQAGGQPVNCIARWNGTTWSDVGGGVGGGASNNVSALLVAGTALYVGGDFRTAGGQSIVQLAKWDGTSWSGPATGPNDKISALGMVNGRVWAGGNFQTVRMSGIWNRVNYLAEWDGSRWWTVSTSVDGAIGAMAVRGSEVFVAGQFERIDTTRAHNIAHWDGTTWHALGDGLTSPFSNPSYATALLLRGTDLYVGGSFQLAGGQPAANIARWDGAAWHPLGAGLDGRANCLLNAGAALYVGGDFAHAGGQNAASLAQWNGTAWTQLAGGVRSNIAYVVYDMALIGSDLYVCGDVDEFGSTSVSITALAKWDGIRWTDIGGRFSNQDVARLAVVGSDLYVGGSFTQVAGQPAESIARWDGTAWHPILGLAPHHGASVSVNALVGHGQHLFAAGSFTLPGIPGSQASYNIAHWDGGSWQGLGTGLNRTVYALGVGDSVICASGSFTYVGDSSLMSAGFGIYRGSFPSLVTAAPIPFSAAAPYRLFPNPTAAGTTVRVELPFSYPETALILDATGRTVKRATVDAFHGLDVRGLAPGTYVVRIGTAAMRLLIE